MATSVVSAPALEARRRFGTTQDRPFGTLLVIGCTLLALAVHGFHPYAEDGGLYMSGIKRLLDPTLYPHGTEFVVEHLRFSFFAPTVALLVRASGLGAQGGLPVVLLTLHVVSVWATLFAAWTLTGHFGISRHARAGAVVLLACWLGLPVAGTSLLLMDPSVTARSFSTPCSLFAVAGAIDWTDWTDWRKRTGSRRRRGLLLCTSALAVAAAMHPLMASYTLGAVIVLFCLRSGRRTVRLWGTAALCAAALAVACIVDRSAPPEGPAYVRIAMTRPYWYLAAWRWYEWVGLAAPIAILAWTSFDLPAGRRAGGHFASRDLARMAVTAGSTAILAALLFAHAGSPTHLIARMQPLRLFQIVYLVLILVLGCALGDYVLRSSPVRWVAAIVLLGGTMLAAERATYPATRHLETPWSSTRNRWAQAFLWVRSHTPKDALFALDPEYISAPGEDAQCFRPLAERSALPDYSKDGGEASITPALTPAWTRAQAAQAGLSLPSTTDAQRLAALIPLGVDWVVLRTSAITALDCPYSNPEVRVCRLR